MQVKNASFFQLHIEKIILAAGALFLIIAVAVVVFGVILKPYQVELGNQTFDDPAEIIPAQVSKAERLNAGLQSTGREQPEAVPADYTVPDLETNFRVMLEQPVVEESLLGDGNGLATLGHIGLQDGMIDIPPPPPPTYYLPTPPMVEDTEYKHGFEVLDTTDRALTDAYYAMWDERRTPADFSYVFIEGTFDLGEWIERLQDTPEQGVMVPYGIWSTKLGLANVFLIREQRDPVTGAWTDRTIVPLLPDQYGVKPDVHPHPDDYTAQEYIDWYLTLQAEIAQPVPPPLINDGELLPPKDDPMLQIDPEVLEAMEEAERAAERARRRAEQEAERARRAAEREAQRNQNNGGGGPGGLGPGGGRGGGRGGGAATPGRGGPGSETAPGGGRGGRDTQPGRGGPEALPIDPLGPGRGGIDTPDIPGRGGPGSRGGLGGTTDNEPLDPDLIRVWAVDVTVQPGTTYRYKIVAGVINPLFGVARLDEAQLSENAGRAALIPSQEEIDKAPWIEPVEIEPSNRFFVVRASDRGANVNVWRVHNGERIKHEFEVNPGDPIGGIVPVEDEDGIMHDVDMLVGATVVDIDRRRDINGQTIWTLIYIDDYGNLHERQLSEDQSASSQFERRLREEEEARERALDMMPGNTGPDGTGRPGEFGPGGPGGLGPGGLLPGQDPRGGRGGARGR